MAETANIKIICEYRGSVKIRHYWYTDGMLYPYNTKTNPNRTLIGNIRIIAVSKPVPGENRTREEYQLFVNDKRVAEKTEICEIRNGVVTAIVGWG